MRFSFDPFSFVVVVVAGWMNQHQQGVIAYLVEENRVLREQIGNRRLRFSDNQRRRLAAKAKKLGHKTLGQVATIAAPETLLTWHRTLIGGKQAGKARRSPGRAAHRDTFFRKLEGIVVGDTIQFATVRRTYEYVVDSTETVDPQNTQLMESRARPELTLITCYPFYFVGAAPKRFVVHARPMK